MSKFASILFAVLCGAYGPGPPVSVHITLPEQGDKPLRLAAEPNDISSEHLDGKEVVARLYSNWRRDPRAYEKVHLGLFERSIEIDSNNIADDTVLVVIGRDQIDPAVRSLLGDFVFARAYRDIKRRSTSLYFYGRPIPEDRWWTFTDAIGGPIPSAEVEVELYRHDGPAISLGRFILDGKGRLRRMIQPVAYLDSLRFEISHPQYGVARMDRIKHDSGDIRTPLVQAGTDADTRAVWGLVLDPEYNPIPRATVRCTSARTLGQGLIEPVTECRYEVLTDRSGQFRFYLPNRDTRNERGFLIPPKSTYSIIIEAPKRLGLLQHSGKMVNGRQTTIVMEPAGYFRTFVFEDENGPITDPKVLKRISVSIGRPDKPSLSFGYEGWKDGGLFPLGTYTPAFWQADSESRFEQIEVTEYSPRTLVFKITDHIHYFGRVVHGLTGESMPGAFVIGMNSGGGRNLSELTVEQWEALHNLPSDPCIDDPALAPIHKLYGFKKVVRTDENGRFSMSFRPGRDLYGFVAFEQDYLALKHRKHRLKPDEDNFAEVPTMKLYPAAKVLVEPCVEEKRLSIWPRWLIDNDGNPPWVKDFLTTDDRSESLFEYDRLLRPNTPQSLHVPAGLNLRLRLTSPYNKKWSPITIPRMICLEQGQVLDLGRVDFELALEVLVKVIDSWGQPVEGAPVRVWCGRNAWSLAHNSNAEGKAVLFVPPHVSGKFAVHYHGESLHLKEEIPYEVAGQEDRGREFILQLSDEILYHLFK